MEFNKEGLLVLAKKITNQNFSLPKNILLKTNQILLNPILFKSFIKQNNNLSPKDSIVNNLDENINLPTKKILKLKNKFLEQNNIQINEEKMMHLLSERKRKMKLALSQRNNKTKYGNNKIIYINLEKAGNNIINNITGIQQKNSRDNIHKYIKILKYNTKFEKNKTYNENLFDCINENIKIEKKKSLINSNSEYFNNNISKNFVSDRKSMKNIGSNINLSLTNSYLNNNNFNNKLNNYSRNEESNNIINHFYSIKKINKPKIDEINLENNENDDNPKNNKKSINNNININININNSINGNINNIKKIDNKKIKKRKKSFNRLFQPNKYISYKQKASNLNNQTDINDVNNTDYHSLIEEEKEKNDNYTSEKIIKKYVSHKRYYLKNIKRNNESNEDEEEFEDPNNDEKDNYIDNQKEREMTYEGTERNTLNFRDYNMYNINVNFTSDEKNNSSNNGYINSGNNFKYLNSNNRSLIRLGSILSPRREDDLKNKNIDFYESSGNNNQMYSSQMIKKSKNLKNEIKLNNKENNLESISKLIQKKYHKVKPFTNTFNNNDLNNSNKKKQDNLINNKRDNIIQLEDLLILEGKFCHLFDHLKYENPIPKICVEWWNFYNYSSFFGKFPKLFPKTNENEDNNSNNNFIIQDYQIAHDTVMYEVLSMIIIYKILCCSPSNKDLINNLKNLINEVHQNFLIECDYILSKVSSQSYSNLWVKKLKNIILSKKNWDEEDSNNNNFHLSLLRKGNKRIQNLLQYLINIYINDYSKKIDSLASLTYYNKNIQKIPLKELSGYFNKAISKENAKINKAFSNIIKKNINNKSKFISIVVPYLPEEIEDKKIYTLVLDLDETLISFRIDKKGRGILKMRPGLFIFLKNVKIKYEIIIFTAGTQEYADPILDSIEKRGKFFAKRLYRQHAILMNNIYIKDLTRLGRDLSKTIIVDNMPQNFSLQKENGILINNYFGQDKYETTLNDLSSILLKISSNPNNDVRKELKKYREEIFTKITTSLNC